MGLGLSALVAIILILPGFLFLSGVNRLFSPSSPPSPLDQHLSVELVIAVFAAIFLHLLGLTLFWLLTTVVGTAVPAPGLAIALLAGSLEPKIAMDALASVEKYYVRILLYFLFISILGFIIGKYLNKKLPAKKSPANWHDILRPEQRAGSPAIALILITVEVSHCDKTYLYSGYLGDFLLGRDGNIERIVLQDYAARRSFENLKKNDTKKEASVLPDGWEEIPGEFFIVDMKNVQTVNVDYYFEEESEERK